MKAFNSSKKLRRMSFEVEGILLSRDRMTQGLEFKETAELEDLDLGAMGIKTQVPVLDRFSPLSYSIVQHVHWDLARHRGAETCSRMSLEQVHIIQGAGLYRELGEDCTWCKVKRKRYQEAAFGPAKDTQTTLAPPMYYCQIDLFDPYQLYVPGKEHVTRSNPRSQKGLQGHVMAFTCPTTRLINLQVLEGGKSSDIISGVARLACELGGSTLTSPRPRCSHSTTSSLTPEGCSSSLTDSLGLSLRYVQFLGITPMATWRE